MVIWVETGDIQGVQPQSSAKRRRRKPPYLAIQELERRTLLSITTSFNSGVLDVNFSAPGDQALLVPSGSTIDVSGPNYSLKSFSDVVVQGGNTSSQDMPNQSLAIGNGSAAKQLQLGGIAPSSQTTPYTNAALYVSGVTTVTFNDVTVDATSGDVDVLASKSGAPSVTTPGPGVQEAKSAPTASISIAGASIQADNIALDATASSTYTYSASSGGAFNSAGFAAALADLEPSASVTINGSASQVTVNGTGGNGTIASNARSLSEKDRPRGV